MKWWERRWIDVGNGDKVNSLWHCFGVKNEIVDRTAALAMLHASGTSLLPINCHRGEPIIGHGDITWDDFKVEAERLNLVPCLNINLQTTARKARELARRARDQTGINLLKLEVLTDDLRSSNDLACIDTTEWLQSEGFRVMPLISCDSVLSRALDVDVLRVMGSPIGSGLGVQKPAELHEITSRATPVILDGGVGSMDHIFDAFRFGCAGVLVNSMLFRDQHPVDALLAIRGRMGGRPIDWGGMTDREMWNEQFERGRTR